MRLLSQPSVLARAGVAASISCIACYPRLALWTTRAEPLWFLLAILLWCLFVMWAFVFAWQSEHAHRPVFESRFKPKVWLAASACALSWAVALHFLVDPRHRLLVPADFPTDARSWFAMCLFALAFHPLFHTFAPFAFFIRLLRKQSVSVSLTVAFNVFVLYAKLSSFSPAPPLWFAVQLAAIGTLGCFLTIHFYLNGGALVVWWMVLIVQLRHLAGPGWI
jgi:hypothetical protein